MADQAYTPRPCPTCGYQMDRVEKLNNEVAQLRIFPREAVAQWMIKRGYATGHGDTIEDLLAELEGQLKIPFGKHSVYDAIPVNVQNALQIVRSWLDAAEATNPKKGSL